jgi:hypothetical protein
MESVRRKPPGVEMEAVRRKPPGVRHRRIPIQFNVQRACPESPGRLRDTATVTGSLARLRYSHRAACATPLQSPGRLRDSATVTELSFFVYGAIVLVENA